jgi:hypothetical protein
MFEIRLKMIEIIAWRVGLMRGCINLILTKIITYLKV